MNKDELLEIREYHFKKIKRLLETYIDREVDYKTSFISDSRLLNINKLISELRCETERINEIDTMLYNCDD